MVFNGQHGPRWTKSVSYSSFSSRPFVFEPRCASGRGSLGLPPALVHHSHGKSRTLQTPSVSGQMVRLPGGEFLASPGWPLGHSCGSALAMLVYFIDSVSEFKHRARFYRRHSVVGGPPGLTCNLAASFAWRLDLGESPGVSGDPDVVRPHPGVLGRRVDSGPGSRAEQEWNRVRFEAESGVAGGWRDDSGGG
jgi:hypothetical protein